MAKIILKIDRDKEKIEDSIGSKLYLVDHNNLNGSLKGYFYVVFEEYTMEPGEPNPRVVELRKSIAKIPGVIDAKFACPVLEPKIRTLGDEIGTSI